MEMGKYLRFLRESRGLTQRQLASQLGIDPTYLCHIECGRKRYLGKKMKQKLDEELGLTDNEMRKLQELREIASGKLAVPVEITTEVASMLRILAEASCQMSVREMVMAKMLVDLLAHPAHGQGHRESKTM